MHTTRRLSLVVLCGAAFAAVTAAPAEALPGVATGAATPSTNSAVVTGVVAPDGAATFYQFLYGTTTAYTQKTPLMEIAAGTTAPQTVSATITGLTPATTYHYELIALAETSPYTTPLSGGDSSFTTTTPAKGTLRLNSSKLRVKHRRVAVSLSCQSVFTCAGKLTITTTRKVRKKTKTVKCVNSKAFSIAAGKSTTLKFKVSGGCEKLLKRRHKIHGKLRAKVSTGQPNLNKRVTLKGK